MKRKFVLLALAAVLVAAISVTAFAVLEEPEEEPYVDSWEVTGNMTEEELIAIGEQYLCDGQITRHLFAVIVRLQDIDPELSQACFQRVQEASAPARLPEQKYEDTPVRQSGEKERFGVTYSNGGNEYTEYYDFNGEGSAVPSQAE